MFLLQMQDCLRLSMFLLLIENNTLFCAFECRCVQAECINQCYRSQAYLVITTDIYLYKHLLKSVPTNENLHCNFFCKLEGSLCHAFIHQEQRPQCTMPIL